MYLPIIRDFTSTATYAKITRKQFNNHDFIMGTLQYLYIHVHNCFVIFLKLSKELVDDDLNEPFGKPMAVTHFQLQTVLG